MRSYVLSSEPASKERQMNMKLTVRTIEATSCRHTPNGWYPNSSLAAFYPRDDSACTETKVGCTGWIPENC